MGKKKSKKKSKATERPECIRCIYTYWRGCPCGGSLHNAACLTLFRDIDDIIKLLKEYATSQGLMKG